VFSVLLNFDLIAQKTDAQIIFELCINEKIKSQKGIKMFSKASFKIIIQDTILRNIQLDTSQLLKYKKLNKFLDINNLKVLRQQLHILDWSFIKQNNDACVISINEIDSVFNLKGGKQWVDFYKDYPEPTKSYYIFSQPILFANNEYAIVKYINKCDFCSNSAIFLYKKKQIGKWEKIYAFAQWAE
jgi:hypothetical protein